MQTTAALAIASLILGILTLFNQRRIEKFKNNLDFEKVRFNKLFEAKEQVVNLAIGNIEMSQATQNVPLELEHSSYYLKLVEKQRTILFEASKIYRYNKNLLNKDLRKNLDITMKPLEAKISNSNSLEKEKCLLEYSMESIEPTKKRLVECCTLLSEFLPELEDSIDKQLDLTLSYIQEDTYPNIPTLVESFKKKNKE
jgi:hypothetical protein